MAFYNDEYKALLAAQRTLTLALEPRTNEKGEVVTIEPRDAAMVASALTRVVDQKRVMRGQPAPKPAEMGKPKRTKSPTSSWVDPSSPDGPSKPSA